MAAATAAAARRRRPTPRARQWQQRHGADDAAVAAALRTRRRGRGRRGGAARVRMKDVVVDELQGERVGRRVEFVAARGGLPDDGTRRVVRHRAATSAVNSHVPIAEAVAAGVGQPSTSGSAPPPSRRTPSTQTVRRTPVAPGGGGGSGGRGGGGGGSGDGGRGGVTATQDSSGTWRTRTSRKRCAPPLSASVCAPSATPAAIVAPQQNWSPPITSESHNWKSTAAESGTSAQHEPAKLYSGELSAALRHFQCCVATERIGWTLPVAGAWSGLRAANRALVGHRGWNRRILAAYDPKSCAASQESRQGSRSSGWRRRVHSFLHLKDGDSRRPAVNFSPAGRPGINFCRRPLSRARSVPWRLATTLVHRPAHTLNSPTSPVPTGSTSPRAVQRAKAAKANESRV